MIRKNKLKIVMALIVLILLSILTLYLFHNKKENTDLSDLMFNDLYLGQNIDDVPNAKPFSDDNWDYDGDYSVGKIAINVDDNGNITKLFLQNDETDKIVLNGSPVEQNLKDIKIAFGDGYNCKCYDYGQGFDELIYYDLKNKTQLQVVYYETDKGYEINSYIFSIDE